MDELMKTNDMGRNYIVDFSSAETVISTFKPKNIAEQTQLFNWINTPDERLADHINQEIWVKDIYVEEVDCTDNETGEITRAPRIVLIDVGEAAYTCVSKGVYTGLKKLCSAFGLPTWENGLPIIPVTVTKGKYKVLTFKLGKLGE